MSTTRKSGLGRGLGALLREVNVAAPVAPSERQPDRTDRQSGESQAAAAPAAASGLEGNVTDIPVDSISRGTYQPRVHFDPETLQELADSITAQGLIQPILLRRRGGGYELIAGERRWRAAQLAGLKVIPAIVREMDDSAVAAVTLIENLSLIHI